MNKIRHAIFWLAVVLAVRLLIHWRNCSYLIKNHRPINIHINIDEGPEEDSQMRQKEPSHQVIPRPKCQENTSAANITGFSSFPSQIKDFLSYRHCRHFSMLLDVPDKCGGADKSADVFFLLVIKTSPGNYKRREVLRKTWAKERLHNGKKIRRVFITGTTYTGLKKLRQNKLLELEHYEYNDILQWDLVDTHMNLTVKQILFLEWMEKTCPNARFLLNGDDDVFANTDNMMKYLQGLEDNDGSKHLFVGNVKLSDVPVRNPLSKYFVPVQVQESNSYPPYCSGGSILLSHYTAKVIYIMSQSIPIFPMDDVYLGMCLAEAGLRPFPLKGVWAAGINKVNKYDPCFYQDILWSHGYPPEDISLMWEKTHDSKLKC